MDEPYVEKKERTYAAIDLKSFFASVECVERGLDAMTTHLVVADETRTEKTICLAVSPALKAYGIPGRPRLFEVVQQVKEVNQARQRKWGRPLQGEYDDATLLAKHPEGALGFIVAPPHMAHYIDYSRRIHEVYQRFVSPEHILVYSIDEVFMDITDYLRIYKTSPRELVSRMINDVYKEVKITATGGIGTNLYLAKVAMDILAKHTEPDASGVRIAELDEMTYRHRLWHHRPLTSFWSVGKGTARKLEEHGMHTMGDIARRSLRYESSLYNLFGVKAELLIDHAWGCEPCTMAAAKSYQSVNSSLSSGQVLASPYTYDKARLVVAEMADSLALSLVEKGLVTEQLDLTIGYDVESLKLPGINYNGEIRVDRYGRRVPKPAHGTEHTEVRSSSSHLIRRAIDKIFERVVNPDLLIRKITVAAQRVIPASEAPAPLHQGMLFSMDGEQEPEHPAIGKEELEREQRIQETLLDIKKKFGKNAIVRGMNFMDGATAMKRNSQIGGHQA